MFSCGGGGFCSRPVFPETMVVTVPFGPSGFLKVMFSMQIGSFYVFSVFLCAIFYPPQRLRDGVPRARIQ